MEKCDYIKISKGKTNSFIRCVSGKKKLITVYNYEWFTLKICNIFSKLWKTYICFICIFLYHCPQAGYSQMRILKFLVRNTLIIFILFAIVQIILYLCGSSLFLYFPQAHKSIAYFSVNRIYFLSYIKYYLLYITFWSLLINLKS